MTWLALTLRSTVVTYAGASTTSDGELMNTPRIDPKDLLSAEEMTLFTLSQDSAALAERTPKQLLDKISRTRALRDRARDMYRRQVGQTRAVTGSKRGFSGAANERTRQKGEVLHAVVERLTQAHAQQTA